MIYSANPAGDTFGQPNLGALDSGNTAIWNATLATLAPGSISGSRYVFAYQPTLNVSTVDFSKTYHTTLTSADAPFAVSGYQPGVSGAFLGDTGATAFAGRPLIDSAGFAKLATVAGSPYATTIGLGTLTSNAGYAFALSSPGLLTVNPVQQPAQIAAPASAIDDRNGTP